MAPKFVSPSDPAAQWTGAQRGPAFFAYSDNYLIDVKFGVIMDVEASRAIRQAEVGAAKTMIERTEQRFDIKPARLAGDTAYGSGANLNWLVARQRSHSIAFKRQVAQEFIAGETLYGLSKRHDISRQLIRVWVQKYEAGALDEDAQAADLLQEYEAKIAALERMVGRQALEIEFLKGALKNAPRPRNANTSVIAGPAASPSQKDAG